MIITDRIAPDLLWFERLLEAPVEKVWQFLIDPELRARWFMGGPTDPRVGGAIGMTMNHDQLSDAGVPDFWALHREAEAAVLRVLGASA